MPVRKAHALLVAPLTPASACQPLWSIPTVTSLAMSSSAHCAGLLAIAVCSSAGTVAAAERGGPERRQPCRALRRCCLCAAVPAQLRHCTSFTDVCRQKTRRLLTFWPPPDCRWGFQPQGGPACDVRGAVSDEQRRKRRRPPASPAPHHRHNNQYTLRAHGYDLPDATARCCSSWLHENVACATVSAW